MTIWQHYQPQDLTDMYTVPNIFRADILFQCILSIHQDIPCWVLKQISINFSGLKAYTVHSLLLMELT
jgi:hypothetical protein